VTERQPLKLVVAYDRNRNEYSLVAHNQTPEEAQSFLDQWTRHLRPGSYLIVLDQAKQHQREEAQECRACREFVARSGHFEPQPRFIRRSQ
jgi:hypothetical protein